MEELDPAQLRAVMANALMGAERRSLAARIWDEVSWLGPLADPGD